MSSSGVANKNKTKTKSNNKKTSSSSSLNGKGITKSKPPAAAPSQHVHFAGNHAAPANKSHLRRLCESIGAADPYDTATNTAIAVLNNVGILPLLATPAQRYASLCASQQYRTLCERYATQRIAEAEAEARGENIGAGDGSDLENENANEDSVSDNDNVDEKAKSKN
jgi:hypothetical protein